MKKTVLVTGSSRGIGKAIALRFAELGYQVVLHASRPSEELHQTEVQLKKIGGWVMTCPFDVSSKVSIDLGCSKMLAAVGPIEILVNNAGINRDKSFLKMTEQEWDEVLKTNLYAPFFIAQHLLPGMKEQKFGRIINMSSMVALKGNFGQTNYAASKAGLIGLTKTLAKEVTKYGVTVNAVCPGLIETDMTARIPQEHKEFLLSQVPSGRMGTPEEVASLVAHLAQPESQYITGSVLEMNGGWM